MQLFIVDAFTDQLFGGNQAGVVMLRDDQPYPDDRVMQSIAAELKHSETAFVKHTGENVYQLRYFTPAGEVELCGHATVSAFTVLREERQIGAGDYIAQTLSGDLRVTVEQDRIWLEMPKGELVRYLTDEEMNLAYRAYRLDSGERPEELRPCIVRVGLADILLPVKSKESLDRAAQDRDAVIRLSRELEVVGAHLYHYAGTEAVTAYCRNFAPLFGIDEEAATGTSNASLTYYLDRAGMIPRDTVLSFRQGEKMGKPSTVYSRISPDGVIVIGGSAVISIRGEISI